MSSKQFDLLIFGVTSIIGEILCLRYLVEHSWLDGEFRWAVADRSKVNWKNCGKALEVAHEGSGQSVSS